MVELGANEARHGSQDVHLGLARRLKLLALRLALLVLLRLLVNPQTYREGVDEGDGPGINGWSASCAMSESLRFTTSGEWTSTTSLDPADGVPWNSAHTGSRRIDQTSLESVQRRSFWREPSWLSRPLQPCSTPDQPGRTESAPLETKILT